MGDEAKSVVSAALARAGIAIDGDQPFDVRVKGSGVYRAFVGGGLEGAWDAYVDGLWETDRLDEVTFRVLRSGLDVQHAPPLASRLRRSPRPPHEHAEAGRRGREGEAPLRPRQRPLFEAMLDRRMVYSCAYWKEAGTLEAAQEAKLDLVCRKIGLDRGVQPAWTSGAGGAASPSSRPSATGRASSSRPSRAPRPSGRGSVAEACPSR